MDTLWKLIFLSTVALACQIVQVFGQNYQDESEDFDNFDFPRSNSYTDNAQKRFSKFVRIGRGLSSFIRIGRQFPFEKLDLYQFSNSPNAIDNDNSDTGQSAFYEMQPENFEQPAKRLSSFVRIGRNYDDENEIDDVMSKRGGAFIRMGKFPSSAFLRNRGGNSNGYTAQPYYRRTGRIGHSSFIRIGKRDTSDAVRRMSDNENFHDNDDLMQQMQNSDVGNDIDSIPNSQERRYLKIGREVDDDGTFQLNGDKVDGKQYFESNVTDGMEDDSQLLRDAYNESTNEDFNKRLSNFVRIGRAEPSTNDLLDKLDQKRYSKFVRIGKNNNAIPNKRRISSFVRIGRQNGLSDNVSKRRISSFVRIGKKSSSMDSTEDQETKLLGENWTPTDADDNINKRISSFVRIGKSPKHVDDDFNKRYSSFVRIGKSGENLENNFAKRYSSFVRIGRNYPKLKDEYNKRLSSFIRLGKDNAGADDELNKRISSFVRIGKNSPSLFDQADKRYSSFVRIGKSTSDLDPNNHKRLSSFIRVGKRTTDKSLNAV